MSNYFIPNTTYNNAIEKKEIGVLKALLVGILAGDPTFATTEFEEAKKYIEEKGIKLEEDYVKLEGEYASEESEWDEKYYQMQLVWLEDNFSKERMNEIKKIGGIVYRNKDTLGKIKQANKGQGGNEPSKENNKTNEKKVDKTPGIFQKWWVLLVIIVVVIVLIVGCCKFFMRRV